MSNETETRHQVVDRRTREVLSEPLSHGEALELAKRLNSERRRRCAIVEIGKSERLARERGL